MPPRAGSGRLSKLRRATDSVKAKAVKARSKQSALDTSPTVVQRAVLTPKTNPAPPRLSAASSSRRPTWLPANLNTVIALRIPAATAASDARAARRAAARYAQARLQLVASTQVALANSRVGAGKSKLVPSASQYGSLESLQTLLGIAQPRRDLPQTLGPPDKPSPPSNAVLVSIDTEFERSGLLDYVIEVGITILRIPKIYGTAPGERICNWSAAMEHRHIVLDVTRKPRYRMRGSLFGKSLLMDPDDAKAAISKILHAAATHQPLPTGQPSEEPPETETPAEPREPADLILVGQSIAGDIIALKDRPLHIDLQPTAAPATPTPTPQQQDPDSAPPPPPPPQPPLPRFKAVYDTLALTQQARKRGASFPSAKLGYVARLIGIDPDYWDGSSVRGAHNASNDAAYAMMVLLLHAVRGESLGKAGALEEVPAEEEGGAEVYGSMMPVERESKRKGGVLVGVVRLGVVGVVAGLVQLALLGLGPGAEEGGDEGDGDGDA
ncbi:hypothetical protein B0A55_04039 [Friedmanniomyces simplex]|uniref:Gfd2/YDR514C-like C-terminal domain-containing protein n=1 Tax=Friedmanniomyces simplex TaxID=329884 RepID=A0A4V5NGF4_9PEZI|nr:hypothetical protein B0A55_04039 [Friedmanniomyces simplex]